METIRSSRDVDRLFRTGTRARRTAVIVLSVPTPEGRGPAGRVVFVAGKALGTAVTRNRCKRVLRETLRRVGGSWPGRDVALVATRSTALSRPEKIADELESGLRELGVTP